MSSLFPFDPLCISVSLSRCRAVVRMEMTSLSLSPFHTLCISPVAGKLFQFFVYVSLPGSPGLGAKVAGPRQAGKLDHHRDGCLCAPGVPRHSGGQLLLRIVRCESGFRASCGYASPMGRAPSPQVTSETVDGGSPTFPISLVQTHVSCQCKREDPKSRRTPPVLRMRCRTSAFAPETPTPRIRTSYCTKWQWR